MNIKTISLLLFFSLIPLLNNTSLAAKNKLGIYAGFNYFDKIQKPKYIPVTDETGSAGKDIFDNDGNSFQIGIMYIFRSRFGFNMQYQTKRKCEFHYPCSDTPFVYGPNTNWTRSIVSNWSVGFNIYFWKIQKLKLYTGIDINYSKIEGYTRTGHIHPTTHKLLYIFPIDGYYYWGSMKITNPSISLGIQTDIFKRFSMNLMVKYYSGKIDEWKGGDSPNIYVNNQRLSGIYYLMNFIFLIKQ